MKNIPEWIIVHHSAVSYYKNPDQFEANNNYHKGKWNFKSKLGFYLGYHYEISSTGKIRQAREEDEEGAHCIGYNNSSIGICLDGEFDSEYPMPQQEDCLRWLLKDLISRYGNLPIVPHRKFANKSCYGKLLADDWASNLIKENNMQVDTGLLTDIYAELLFRAPDAGAQGYIGQSDTFVRSEIMKSSERQDLEALINAARKVCPNN